MILKKTTQFLIALSLVFTLVLTVHQSALAVPGECPPNTQFIVKYEWNGTSWFAAAGTDVITFGAGSNLHDGSWTSSVLIAALVITDGKERGGGEVVWTQKFYEPPTNGPQEYHSYWMEPEQDPAKEISNLVFCGPIWPVTLASIGASARRGAVTIDWTTATEINTAGFFIYRSGTVDGPMVQVNGNLIAAQGEQVRGASYMFTDQPGYGTFYYWLKDVDYTGQSGFHGPVLVKVLPPILQPLYRPSLPGQ